MIDRVVTSGTFSLDGGTWDVDNNVWLVGSAEEVVVIDAAHDAGAIAERIGGRSVTAIVCTHAHNDHVNAAVELAARVDAPILLHPADQVLWEMVHPGTPYTPLRDGQVLKAGGVELTVLHTPGHAPGAVCLHAPDVGAVFTGDTLFQGGPGATGRSFSSFETIIDSIRGRLLTLPERTVVHTGHGDSTTIGAEAPHLEEWLKR
ncbi:hydrolase [Planomonospora parontospora subsp. antibiotica]|uniref:MBL fold metallo-hydrolase n=2 Tax=Planomonospora parontospora TaxID=58119 RepID=UPI001670DF17|nr:MBL fold metallo-hydrolase [Planomonospora parontospora]GGL09566.1 hydrolase [Planomonospora parontospora subsp. antibiotica]